MRVFASSHPSAHPSARFSTLRLVSRLALAAAACALPACGGEDTDEDTAGDPAAGETGTAAQGVVMCDYHTFEVEVVSGPSAGTKVEGSLLLVLTPPSTRLVGTLGTAAGAIPVTGAYARGGEVSLTFHTADGYVMGLGRAGEDFCNGDATLEGVAVGPRVSETDDLGESDTGHWLLANPNRLISSLGGATVSDDPLAGATFVAAQPSGCTTSGATQVCNSAVYGDAGSATGCSQSTSTCTFNGTRNECSSTHVPVDCPN